jgi:hypothetical protein
MQVQVGAMAHGKIDVDYIDDLVAGIFCLPLSASIVLF